MIVGHLGHWEGDLIIGAHGTSAAATLVERTTRFVTILALPVGEGTPEGLCDVLIDHINTIPDVMRGSLTWDQGSEMARHAALTLATDMKVYFAHPRSPWERGTNENTGGLIREYLPKGTQVTTHQPYLNAIAEELGWTPQSSLGMAHPTRSIRTSTRCFHHLTPRGSQRMNLLHHRRGPLHRLHQRFGTFLHLSGLLLLRLT